MNLNTGIKKKQQKKTLLAQIYLKVFSVNESFQSTEGTYKYNLHKNIYLHISILYAQYTVHSKCTGTV